MNTLGKILVFVNLIFSVVTGALIVMVFITRTQWEKGYRDVSAQLVGERSAVVPRKLVENRAARGAHAEGVLE